MIKSATTRHRLVNAQYPSIMIHWRKSADIEEPAWTGPDSWQGDATVWFDSNKKSDITFIVQLGQSTPLEGIHFSLNPCEYGARAFSSIPGTGISERDLLWCGEWAVSHMKQEIVEASLKQNSNGDSE